MYTPMCHYRHNVKGLAFDDTPFQNHGLSSNTDYEADGTAIGSGVAKLLSAASRIRITNNSSWQHLKALRITMTIRLDAVPTQRANLVEGHLAFAFFIEPGGALTATILGVETLGGPKVWHGVTSSAPYSPDGLTHVVPANQWVTVGCEHDGFANFRLTINGKSVAQRSDLVSSVGSVGGLGVSIGNWPDADTYPLLGRLDDLLIEKYDQDALTHEFIGRPWTPAEGNCWLTVLQAIAAAVRAGNAQVLQALATLQWLRDNVVRQILKHGPDIQQQNAKFAERFVDLWMKGWLGTPEMESLLREWLCWLKVVVGLDLNAVGTSLQSRPSTHSGGPQLSLGSLLELLGERSCDKDFILLLKTIQRVLSGQKDCRMQPEKSKPC